MMVGEAGPAPRLRRSNRGNSLLRRHFLLCTFLQCLCGSPRFLHYFRLRLTTVGTPSNFNHTPHNFPHNSSAHFRTRIAPESPTARWWTEARMQKADRTQRPHSPERTFKAEPIPAKLGRRIGLRHDHQFSTSQRLNFWVSGHLLMPIRHL